MSGAVTADSLTGRHIDAVRRYARANDRKTLLRACDRAARRGPGGDLNFGAMRTVAAAWNRLDEGGLLGPPSQRASSGAVGDGDPDSIEAGESDALIEAAHQAHLSRGAARAPGLPGPAPDASPKLDLDAIDHLAVLGPGGGALTRALIRRVRGLEAKMRATGATLANFIGEDAVEGRELAELSRELISFADAGTDA